MCAIRQGEPGRFRARGISPDSGESRQSRGTHPHCRDIAQSMGKAQEFTALGFTLEYARDAFVRYAVEGATVVSF